MERSVEVAVVGAGMAGLKAAASLVDLGCSVVVLEANDRVGGRLKASEVAGRVVDVGGQWVGARHTVLLEEARRLGIETYPQFAAGKTQLQLGGKLTRFTGDVPAMPFLALWSWRACSGCGRETWPPCPPTRPGALRKRWSGTP